MSNQGNYISDYIYCNVRSHVVLVVILLLVIG